MGGFFETFAYLQRWYATQHYTNSSFASYPAKQIKLNVWGGKGLPAKTMDFFFQLACSSGSTNLPEKHSYVMVCATSIKKKPIKKYGANYIVL